MIQLMELVERVERKGQEPPNCCGYMHFEFESCQTDAIDSLVAIRQWEPRLCTERDCPLAGCEHMTDECAYALAIAEREDLAREMGLTPGR